MGPGKVPGAEPWPGFTFGQDKRPFFPPAAIPASWGGVSYLFLFIYFDEKHHFRAAAVNPRNPSDFAIRGGFPIS